MVCLTWMREHVKLHSAPSELSFLFLQTSQVKTSHTECREPAPITHYLPITPAPPPNPKALCSLLNIPFSTLPSGIKCLSVQDTATAFFTYLPLFGPGLTTLTHSAVVFLAGHFVLRAGFFGFARPAVDSAAAVAAACRSTRSRMC